MNCAVRLPILTLLLCLSSVRAETDLPTDRGETKAFIRMELSRGAKEIRVPAKRTLLEPTQEDVALSLVGLSDVTIDFQGCDFFLTRRVRALELLNCTNVVVKNLTLDYDPLPFTQARITKVGDDKSWDLEVIDGYPVPKAENEYWPMQVYDGVNYELVNEMRAWNGLKLTKTGERTFHVVGDGNLAGAIGDVAVWSVRDDADTKKPCSVYLFRSARCQLENVRLYSSVTGFCMFEFFCDGNTYRRCVIDRRPAATDIRTRAVPRLRSGNHDALHSKMAEKGPTIDGCRFAYHCDDAVNISSFYGAVSEIKGNSVRVLIHDRLNFIVPIFYDCEFKGGDELEILDRSGRVRKGPRVISVRPDEPIQIEECATMKGFQMWPGVPERLNRGIRLEVDDATGLGLYDAVMPARLNGSGFAIRNCHFGPNRALGVRLRACAGVVESNLIERTTGSGLWIGPEFEWMEGAAARNIVVRDNVLSGCGKIGLTVGGHAACRKDVAPDAHGNSVFERNVVTGSSLKPAVFVGCDASVVRDNDLRAKGTNLRGVQLPMRNLTVADFEELSKWGVKLVRYQMTKAFFQKGPDKSGFEHYLKWLDGKLDHLMDFIIPQCRARGMKVVVDLHEPHGGREPTMEWSIYYNREYLGQFVECWRKIATRVKGNEDVVYGYDLLNEPVQKRPAKTLDYLATYEKTAKMVRKIDPKTPIIVESRDWAAPEAFADLRPIDVDNVIYEVHMYRPQAFTHQGTGASPKTVGAKWPDLTKGWNRDFIRERLAAVRAFELKYRAKIFVGEFSAISWGEGAENYLADCIAVFSEYGWDWTYHAFREWEPWSVEHAGTAPGKPCTPSTDNPRKRVLLEGLKGVR